MALFPEIAHSPRTFATLTYVATEQGTDVHLLAERVRHLRLTQDLSREKLGAKAGVSAAYIKKLEEAAMVRPGPMYLDAVARALGFPDRRPLVAGHDPPAQQPPETNVRGRVDDLRERAIAPLPIYRWGTAGDPRDAQSAPNPDREDYPPLGREPLIGSGGFGVDVRGESMGAKNIHDGDTVWVNPARQPRFGQVVLARCWDGDGTDLGMVLKVWVSTPFGAALRSAYQREDERDLLECERFEIIGPVVWVQPAGFPPG